MNGESVAGGLMVLVSAGAIGAALRFPAAGGAVPGPAMFPVMMAGLWAALGGALLVVAQRGERPADRPGGSLRLMFGLLGLTVAYAALMPHLGFVSSSALFVAVAIRLLGYPHGWRAGAVALSSAFIVHALFAGLMNVPLPEGWLG